MCVDARGPDVAEGAVGNVKAVAVGPCLPGKRAWWIHLNAAVTVLALAVPAASCRKPLDNAYGHVNANAKECPLTRWFRGNR